jgi:hypothetical protein
MRQEIEEGKRDREKRNGTKKRHGMEEGDRATEGKGVGPWGQGKEGLI